MHVVSEEGNYSFKRSAPPATDRTFVSAADTPVCGLYVVGNADAVVEISIKYMHVSCESGGLLAVRSLLVVVVPLGGGEWYVENNYVS